MSVTSLPARRRKEHKKLQKKSRAEITDILEEEKVGAAHGIGLGLKMYCHLLLQVAANACALIQRYNSLLRV
jgi:hypothetical protein